MGAITTGPFIVPPVTSGARRGSAPDNFYLTLKNPTTEDFVVDLFLDICTSLNDTGEDHFDILNLTVPSDSCVTVDAEGLVFPNNVLRLSVSGDVNQKANKVEVTVVGFRSSDGMHEPTMFFRHENFVKVKNLNIHISPTVASSLASSSANASNKKWRKK